ncbi:hypothetical protein F5148DRAFT_341255 [Russula earlei]|uniref:Uncharacterized protein n=1 Tax=Russula earlei TaxID=71964 RepID=A0ACC0U2S7_9AGAM|nr:hypothetical protein F5148DRAFT_341255 [Russula earlei]
MMENEYDLESESLDELLSTARSNSPASTGIPTPPFPGLSCLSSLHRGDVIEVRGPPGSGKTHLLYYLICSCILPLRFGGWNKVSIVFDTDGTFDIHRLRTLLRARLPDSFSSDEIATGQIVALRNIHIFRPKSSSQLAAGLANLSSYHMRNLPTSEIALLAIDSASSFYWLDCVEAEQLASAHPISLATPLSIVRSLWDFRRSHYPVTVILTWGQSPTSAARNDPLQLYGLSLPSFPTSVNRISSIPKSSHDFFLTHQITLDLIRIVPPSHNAANEQEMSSLPQHLDIHVHVKTAINHTELLHMQINSQQVLITISDV